jgi:hypothetical protein
VHVPVVRVPVHVPLVRVPVRLVELDNRYGGISSKEDKTRLLLLQRQR